MPLQFAPNVRHTGTLSFSGNSRAVLSSVGLSEATQEEAEAGAILGKYMSPLRTKQAIQGGEFFTQSGSGAVNRTMIAKLRECVSITDFGAVGDGSIANATVNAAALNAALATGRAVFFPYTSSGYHFGTNHFALTDGTTLIGESQVALLSTSSDYLFRLSNSVYPPTTIDNFTIEMLGTSGTTAIRLGTSSAVVYGVRLSRLYFRHCYEAIGDEAHASNYVVDVIIRDVLCYLTHGVQVRFRRSSGFINLDRAQVDRTADPVNVGTVTWGGFQFDEIAGLIMRDCDVTGPVSPTTDQPYYAIQITGSGSYNAAVWLDRVNADHTTGSGILIDSINYIWADNLDVGGNLANQLVLANCGKADLTNSFIGGADGRTGAVAGGNGLAIDTCTNIHVSNFGIENCTGNGIVLNDATDCQFVNIRSQSNAGTALIEVGTANRNIFTNFNFASNGADVTLVGAQSAIYGYISGAAFVAIAAIYGGTGQKSYTTGDLLYASSPTALSKLAAVATGNALISGGVGAAPSWGKIDLVAHVTGDLPFSNLAQGSARSVLGVTGNSTADVASIQSSAAGQILNSTASAVAWTATPTLGAAGTTRGTLTMAGNTSGSQVWQPAAAASGTITFPAGTVDFSSTGGSGQVVKQTSAGGIFTVATIAASEIASGAALTRVDDTNVTLTLGGSPTAALLAATSLTLGWSGQLGLTRGGTAANLTASNGGIVYSTASALAILSGTATAGQILRSGASAAPSWSTATYPATVTANRLLYASSTNVVSDLASANSSILVTDGSGVPSLSTTLPAHTLGGTVSGGGNQINNVIIGASNPLAGSFTTLAYSTTLTGTSSNANALAVGRQGATDPVLLVDASTASVATGLKIKGAAAAGGVALSAISSGTNENLTIDAKGSGTITLAGTSTGAITLTRDAAITSTTASTSLVTGALVVGGGIGASGQVTCGLLQVSGSLNGSLLCSIVNGTDGANAASYMAFQAGGGATGLVGQTAPSYSLVPLLANSFIIDSGSTSNIVINCEGAKSIIFGTSSTERGRWQAGLSIGTTTDPGAGALLATASIKSTGATSGIGYATGAGGTVTQATSKSTGVTLDKVCGQITMNNAALNAGVSVSFTLTNSTIAATDTVRVNIQSGASADSYAVDVTAVAAGSCRIQVRNFTAGNLSEALVLNFAVLKGVSS